MKSPPSLTLYNEDANVCESCQDRPKLRRLASVGLPVTPADRRAFRCFDTLDSVELPQDLSQSLIITNDPTLQFETPHKHPSLCRVDIDGSEPRDEGRLADTCTNHVVRSILKSSEQCNRKLPRVTGCNSRNSCNYSCRCSCNPRSLAVIMPGEKLKVQFHAHVFVFYVNILGDHVKTECVRLKGGPNRQRGTEARARWRKINNIVCRPKNSNLQMPVSCDFIPSNEFEVQQVYEQDRDRCSVIGRVRASIISNDKENFDDTNSLETVDIRCVYDPANDNTLLKFSVHIGTDYKPEDIVVKVGKCGVKLKIQATGIDSEDREYEMSRRYLLPRCVDSKLLEADLDRRGVLRVEAPVKQ